MFIRDFIEDNVFSLGCGEVSPILVFDAENVDQEKQVERLSDRSAMAQSDLGRAAKTPAKTLVDLRAYNGSNSRIAVNNCEKLL